MNATMNARSPVLFLDDDEDLRTTLTDLIHIVTDRPCYILRSYQELVALGAGALECGVAILDINLAPGLPGGFDAYRWLKQRGFSGRIVFLSGHEESHPQVAQISRLPDVQVILKPVGFDVLMALLKGEDPAHEVHA
jgi:FixJ family two-component response regulator